MVHKLLLFLQLIGASHGSMDLDKSKEFKIYIDNKQLDIINDQLNDKVNGSLVREVMTIPLQCMKVDAITGDYILTFTFTN